MTTQLDIPESWAPCNIGKLVYIKHGFAFKSEDFCEEPTGFVVTTPGNFAVGGGFQRKKLKFFSGEIPDDYVFEAGDLIVTMTDLSKDGKTLGFSARVPAGLEFRLLHNQRIGRVLPLVDDTVELGFLNYFLRSPSYRAQVLRSSSGSLIRHTSPKKIYAVKLGLPPLNEQRRIVAKIEELTARSRNAKQALDAIPPLLERFRQSVLAAAFRGDLTKQWRQQNPNTEPASELLKRIRQERRHRWEQDYLQTQKAKGKQPKNDKWKEKYQEPEPVATTNLPELPEGWCWASMGEAFEVCVGATPSRKRPDYWGGSIPWVSSGEVAFCRISSTRETITEDGLKNSSTSLHPPGTLLIGMIGEGKTRGQVAILDIEACNNQNAAAIRVSLTPIPTEYVYRYLEGQYQATRLLGSGNNQQALNKTRVQAMIIPIAPLAEQEAICTELETLLSRADAISEFTDNFSDRMTTLNQSILAKAFRGELVPQDPNDEPASALLERIRTVNK